MTFHHLYIYLIFISHNLLASHSLEKDVDLNESVAFYLPHLHIKDKTLKINDLIGNKGFVQIFQREFHDSHFVLPQSLQKCFPHILNILYKSTLNVKDPYNALQIIRNEPLDTIMATIDGLYFFESMGWEEKDQELKHTVRQFLTQILSDGRVVTKQDIALLQKSTIGNMEQEILSIPTVMNIIENEFKKLHSQSYSHNFNIQVSGIKWSNVGLQLAVTHNRQNSIYTFKCFSDGSLQWPHYSKKICEGHTSPTKTLTFKDYAIKINDFIEISAKTDRSKCNLIFSGMDYHKPVCIDYDSIRSKIAILWHHKKTNSIAISIYNNNSLKKFLNTYITEPSKNGFVSLLLDSSQSS